MEETAAQRPRFPRDTHEETCWTGIAHHVSLGALAPSARRCPVQSTHQRRDAEFVHLPPVFFINILVGRVRLLTTRENLPLGIVTDASPVWAQPWSACPAVLSLLRCGHSVPRVPTGCSQVSAAWAPTSPPSWSLAESRALCCRTAPRLLGAAQPLRGQ